MAGNGIDALSSQRHIRYFRLPHAAYLKLLNEDKLA